MTPGYSLKKLPNDTFRNGYIHFEGELLLKSWTLIESERQNDIKLLSQYNSTFYGSSSALKLKSQRVFYKVGYNKCLDCLIFTYHCE